MAAQPFGVAFVASDLPRTLSFYRALGLDIPAEADQEAHVEVVAPNGFRIMFDPVATMKSFDPEWEAPVGSPRAALTFECDGPNEVDALYAAMTDSGFDGHRAPWDAEWGHRYAMLRDPDGNSVDIFAPLPAG